jgi:HPt (histidine-containing phosphotransfer) domain-containing protein
MAARESTGGGDSLASLQVIDSLVRFAGPVIAREMIDAFLTTTPGRLQAASAAARASNRDALQSIARTIKSGASQLGALSLARCCATLEEEAATARAARLGRLVERVVDETALASAWLYGVRERLPATGDAPPA